MLFTKPPFSSVCFFYGGINMTLINENGKIFLENYIDSKYSTADHYYRFVCRKCNESSSAKEINIYNKFKYDEDRYMIIRIPTSMNMAQKMEYLCPKCDTVIDAIRNRQYNATNLISRYNIRAKTNPPN